MCEEAGDGHPGTIENPEVVYFHNSLGWLFLDYSVNDRMGTSETEKVHTFGKKQIKTLSLCRKRNVRLSC